jgi:hypothetical protein
VPYVAAAGKLDHDAIDRRLGAEAVAKRTCGGGIRRLVRAVLTGPIDV